MRSILIAATRAIGWIILAFVIVPVFAILLRGIVHGPAPRILYGEGAAPSALQVLWPSARQWGVLAQTGMIACGAVIGSFLIGVPAAFAIVHVRSGAARTLLYVAIVWPLLAPPCVMAYAWSLLSTQQTSLAEFMTGTLRWHRPEMAPVVAAWVQSMWLWPIPALALVAAFQIRGRHAFRMALLDGSSAAAFWRAALPAMRGAVAAAAVVIFLLSATEAAIAPLMLVPAWWPTEMVSEVTRAARFADPAGYLLWRSWPMMLAGGAVALVAWRVLRPLVHESEDWVHDDLGAGRPGGVWLASSAVILIVAISLLPMGVFVYEMSSPKISLAAAVMSAWRLYARERDATFTIAVLSGCSAIAIALACAGDRHAPRWLGRMRVTAIACLVILAVLPPVVVGRSLITVFDQAWRLPGMGHRTLFDDTPIAWLAGMIARFGFLPALMVNIAQRGDEAADQARCDGATPSQVFAYIRLPELVRTIFAAGLLVGGLATGELALSSMLVPVRIGQSLAVVVDQQIHFGRQEQVVATSLLMTLPAMVVALVIPMLLRTFREARETAP